MTTKGALAAFATLERRSAALVRSELASVRRFEDRGLAEVRAGAATRSLLRCSPEWPAAACAFVHLRGVRTDAVVGALRIRAAHARLAADAHAIEQRRWAQLRRGLELRAERRATQRQSWPD